MRQVKGELELRVCELAAGGARAVRADDGRGPLKQVDAALQPEHLWRALLKGEAGIRGMLGATASSSADAHQLQASLAGEDDSGSVVLRRIRCTLGGAGVGDEHFSRSWVDARAAGGPTDVLQKVGLGGREKVDHRRHQTSVWSKPGVFHMSIAEIMQVDCTTSDL